MADRLYYWLRNHYRIGPSDPGVVNLTDGPITAPATIERLIVHVTGLMPAVNLDDEREIAYRLFLMQAVEITRSALPDPPPLPPPLDFQAGMGSREFLWTGALRTGGWMWRWARPQIPSSGTAEIDTSQRRTPEPLEAIQLWWNWASSAPAPTYDQEWALFSNVLLSEPA